MCDGDKRILETSYATMLKFMTLLLENSPGYIRCAPEYEGWPGFGDWLSINAATPRDLWTAKPSVFIGQMPEYSELYASVYEPDDFKGWLPSPLC